MCLSCLCIYGYTYMWLYVYRYGGAINTYLCIYIFTQERIYVKLYRRMYVYTYVCIYVFMVLCNAAFTQGNMYGMVVWLYVYMYDPRSVSQNFCFVKYFTQQNLWKRFQCPVYVKTFSKFFSWLWSKNLV